MPYESTARVIFTPTDGSDPVELVAVGDEIIEAIAPPQLRDNVRLISGAGWSHAVARDTGNRSRELVITRRDRCLRVVDEVDWMTEWERLPRGSGVLRMEWLETIEDSANPGSRLNIAIEVDEAFLTAPTSATSRDHALRSIKVIGGEMRRLKIIPVSGVEVDNSNSQFIILPKDFKADLSNGIKVGMTVTNGQGSRSDGQGDVFATGSFPIVGFRDRGVGKDIILDVNPRADGATSPTFVGGGFFGDNIIEVVTHEGL